MTMTLGDMLDTANNEVQNTIESWFATGWHVEGTRVSEVATFNLAMRIVADTHRDVRVLRPGKKTISLFAGDMRPDRFDEQDYMAQYNQLVTYRHTLVSECFKGDEYEGVRRVEHRIKCAEGHRLFLKRLYLRSNAPCMWRFRLTNAKEEVEELEVQLTYMKAYWEALRYGSNS